MKRTLLLIFACCAVGAGLARAQEPSKWERLLPHVRYFSPLIADIQEPRMSLAMVVTDLFKRAPEGRERPPFELADPVDSEHDVEVAPGIGGSIPLWHLSKGKANGNGIVAVAQLGVFPRFRIEYPTRTDVGEDWYVGMPFEFRYNRTSGRFRIMHRSSHIGDELVQQSFGDAQRIEFGGEFADFLLAHEFGGARVYVGASDYFRSYNEALPAVRLRGLHDHTSLQAGVDGMWWPWSNGHMGFVAGFDWQTHERTNWRSMFAFAAGPALRVHERGMKLVLRHFHGPSGVGQFFLTPETFTSVEWVVDF